MPTPDSEPTDWRPFVVGMLFLLGALLFAGLVLYDPTLFRGFAKSVTHFQVCPTHTTPLLPLARGATQTLAAEAIGRHTVYLCGELAAEQPRVTLTFLIWQGAQLLHSHSQVHAPGVFYEAVPAQLLQPGQYHMTLFYQREPLGEFSLIVTAK